MSETEKANLLCRVDFPLYGAAMVSFQTVAFLIDWLDDWFIGWLMDDLLIGRLIDWLIDWLIN